jgi:uncharacterized membrane protein YfcA
MLVAALAVVFLGGLVKGTAGFGYAIVSTAVLATLFSPTVAVVVMILVGLSGVAALPGLVGVAAEQRLILPAITN